MGVASHIYLVARGQDFQQMGSHFFLRIVWALVLLRAWPSTLLLLLLCPFLFTPFRWQEFGYSQYHLRMTGLLNNRIKRNWRDDGATHCRAFLT